MRKREVEHYRSVLEGQLAELVGHGEKAVHEMAGEPGDEIPDPNDRATVEEGRNWSLRLRDRDRRLIGKIQDALGRLEAAARVLDLPDEPPVAVAQAERPVASLLDRGAIVGIRDLVPRLAGHLVDGLLDR